jgi:hypothetical protein
MDDEPELRGRYRWRTALRRRLPYALIGLSPKGRRDCGYHQWYKSTEDTDHCYHCEVGERSPSQIRSPGRP